MTAAGAAGAGTDFSTTALGVSATGVTTGGAAGAATGCAATGGCAGACCGAGLPVPTSLQSQPLWSAVGTQLYFLPGANVSTCP